MGSSSSTVAKGVPFQTQFSKWKRQQVQNAWKRAFTTCEKFLVEGEEVPFCTPTPTAYRTPVAAAARTPLASQPGAGDSTGVTPVAAAAPLTTETGSGTDLLTIDTQAAPAPTRKPQARLPGWQSRADRAVLVTKNRTAGMEKPLLVTRRDFMEVFTDITVVMGSGQFLQLPIEVFEWFADVDKYGASSNEKNYCDCRLVLLALSISCSATVKEVGMLLFRAYDVDGTGSLCAVRSTCGLRCRFVVAGASDGRWV